MSASFDAARVAAHAAAAAQDYPEGCLYVVATPIGNLADISLRALWVLQLVDAVACEDTRHTRKLLEHYGIQKPTISYHEHNEAQRAPEIFARLQAGESVALVLASGWDVRIPLVDPFCGSGTVAIEAAMIARRMSPGRHRSPS